MSQPVRPDWERERNVRRARGKDEGKREAGAAGGEGGGEEEEEEAAGRSRTKSS